MISHDRSSTSFTFFPSATETFPVVCACRSAGCSCASQRTPTIPWENGSVYLNVQCTDLDQSSEYLHDVKINGRRVASIIRGGSWRCQRNCNKYIQLGPFGITNPSRGAMSTITISAKSNRHVNLRCGSNTVYIRADVTLQVIGYTGKNSRSVYPHPGHVHKTAVSVYGVLGWTPPSSAETTCQTKWEIMPYGWGLAPDDDTSRAVASSFRWGTSGVVVGGLVYSTHNSSAPSNTSARILQAGQFYRPEKCPQRVLIKLSTTQPFTTAEFVPATMQNPQTGLPCATTYNTTCSAPFTYNMRLGRANEACDDTCASYGEVVRSVDSDAVNTQDKFANVMRQFGIGCSTMIIPNSLAPGIAPAIYANNGTITCVWSDQTSVGLASQLNGMRVCGCVRQ